MTLRTSPWPNGVPCWVDLAVPDVAAAKRFYQAVIGWDYQDTEADYGGYAIAEMPGRQGAAAGIGPKHDDGPSMWTLYFASDDADKAAATVADNGGTILLAPGDVGPLGRMFIAMDPSGAPFGVWQAGTHIGAGLANEPGGLTWEDLRSPDPDAARAFFDALFGYTYEGIAMAGEDYTTFALPSEGFPLGGMGGMMGGDGAPAHWVVYFGVSDTRAAAEAAGKAGGTVVAPPFESPYGVMAGVADPSGAPFWLIQAEQAAMPDRGD
jgi:predicted enzyme related to lactoylglutathione lyase